MPISVQVKGDFAKLSAFQRKLAGSALAKVRRDILDQMAIRSLQMVDRGFDAKRSPYGGKWAKRKRSYPWPTLQRTRGLRSSVKVVATRSGILFSYGKFYGAFHQSGTRHMASRKFIPADGFGLPSRYRKSYQAVVRRVLKDYFA